MGLKSLFNRKKPLVRKHFTMKTKLWVYKWQKGKCAVKGCKATAPHKIGRLRSNQINFYFDFDHIVNRDNNSIRNCQMLCLFHHRKKSFHDRIKDKAEKRLKNGA